ncbi:MAG: response regulator [Pseudomonadota bacterium]
MAEVPARALKMMLMEPETLLRRTVSLTARGIGIGNIHEACTLGAAGRMLRESAFDGAMIAIEGGSGDGLALLDQVRKGETASAPSLPIAVLAAQCDVAMLQELRARDIARIILKPFRARLLLDVFAEMSERARR